MSVTYPKSGNNEIDALIKFSDFAGPLNSVPGTAVTIYYTFGSTPNNSLTALNSTQEASVITVLNSYSDVAGITFIDGLNPVTGAYDLGFFIAPSGSGGSYWPDQNISSGDGAIINGYVEVHNNHLNNFDYLILHETGHALGMDHPANYTGYETAPHLDTNAIIDFSVMGYNDDDSESLTSADIATLQYLYGEKEASTEDAENNLTDNDDVFTIIDSSVVTYGLNGNDNVTGSSNNDSINGNKGDDSLHGQDGDDLLYGGQGSDNLSGNRGIDILYGNKGNDILYGGKDSDTLYGGQDADTLHGNKGDDIIYGDKGNDSLYGGDGSDQFFFNPNNGIDTIYDFEDGLDLLMLSNIIFASDSEAISYTTYQDGNAVITVDGINSITLIGITDLDTSDITIV